MYATVFDYSADTYLLSLQISCFSMNIPFIEYEFFTFHYWLSSHAVWRLPL